MRRLQQRPMIFEHCGGARKAKYAGKSHLRLAVGLAAVVLVMALPACRSAQAPVQQHVQQPPAAYAAGASHPTLAHPRSTVIRSHPDLAMRINALPGLKWATVLQQGSVAYVGVTPDATGWAPKTGQRTHYAWPKTYDSASELARQNPQERLNALDETPPRADTHDFRPRQRSGVMNTANQQAIRKIVSQHLPQVHTVLMTSDVSSSSVLRGYAEYIESGGDMQAYLKRFRQHVNMIWPKGRGLGPHRPSASPNFGPITTPADGRTPATGPGL